MKTAHAAPLSKKTTQQKYAATLEQEARELEALHLGLRRHLAAWRNAHESATTRLGAVMERIDSLLERAEHRQA